MDFLKEIKKNKEEFVKEICELVKIPSVLEEDPLSEEAPLGKPIRESLDYVLDLGKKMGFKTKNVGNVSGHIEYGEGKEIIGVLCHVDVVPADGKWKYPPFSATIEGDKIYGRGTQDDKGPVICSLYALKMIKE
ncbi:MAG: M20/M25/M40 family metallo-hydrolase, partial [Bacilli bacterium]|nr:M20/M25/M40 family metallo-hydrolase [Bacilli bacterium]